ncbi:putative F-box protein At3g16210 [Lycium ferocissimum]|uniref:putative F-box protein At3g16210 n=1 Tax=Lycium ferocissimum TaxID=112874 RepID=UPI002815BC13|nr:putative F-box protein At3g16210 [Lycium ferocissimum]
MIIELLLNLPVKPLVKFKLVCKSWRSLIEDRKFIKQHRDRCQRDVNCHKILLASWKWYYYCDCYSIDAPQFQHERHSDNVTLLELPVLPQFDPEINLTLDAVTYAYDCVFVNSCDGLFLLRFSSDILVLWNPTIKESRIIPPPISIEEEDSNPFLWLPRCDDFEGKMVVDDDGFVYMSTYEYASNMSIIQCMCLKNENFEEISFPDAGVKYPVLFVAGENLLLMNETIDSLVLYSMEKNGMRSS